MKSQARALAPPLAPLRLKNEQQQQQQRRKTRDVTTTRRAYFHAHQHIHHAQEASTLGPPREQATAGATDDCTCCLKASRDSSACAEQGSLARGPARSRVPRRRSTHILTHTSYSESARSRAHGKKEVPTTTMPPRAAAQPAASDPLYQPHLWALVQMVMSRGCMTEADAQREFARITGKPER